ncbi:LOW QUALITY PROTEIN: calcium/calmodulin-dependent protein kinase kinase 2-like, partial [Eurytemora carolleeae]|uniref:LOW QUALITY PROTEIN: calcium/calmodulin-dependent protein kinase kinase 2-like n=1 Tax=Eurytemora carolleeae TaxID=1294199 RepID=UPI000C7633BF
KIADLGVSNEFDGNDAFLTSTVGTPAFTPPECLSQQPGEPPYSGKAADIWSLGVTLYSLVYGRVPFFDNNIVALYNIIKTKNVEIPPGSISAELEDLLTRMLRKDPNQRISLLEIKEHDWVTGCGVFPMLKEDENCVLVGNENDYQVTDIEVQNSVRSIPKLDTLILVKAMLKQHSFSNPFHNIKEKFRKRGRSNSAPGDVHIYLDSHTHTVRLPSLTESGEDSDSACVTGSD